MIAPPMDEVWPRLHELMRVRRAGGSVWRAFWGLAPAGDPARPGQGQHQ